MNGMKRKGLVIISVLFFSLFLFALLNRTGSLILLWKEENPGSITHDSGYGYYAFVQDENISRLSLPFFLKEDDVLLDQGPVSVNEDITVSIKNDGGGRYQLLKNNDLYFSASEGRPEEHEYSILSPSVIRNRYLLALLFPVIFLLAADIFVCVKYKDRTLISTIIRSIAVVILLMLLMPWNNVIFSGAPLRIGLLLVKPILQRNIIYTVILFAAVLAIVLTSQQSRIWIWISVLIILVNTVYYFIPEWDYYGRRADSGAYLQHYNASSIRTPGYPKFIEMVFLMSGHEGLDELREKDAFAEDESLHNCRKENSMGLINVVRAQKCVLAASFLILFIVFRKYYEPLWFVLFAQIVLCNGLLGVDNNYIMTECLSQAFILLTAAMFIMVIKGKQSASFVVMCITAGLSILIRPANIFLGLLIFISVVFLLKSHRKISLLLAGCFLFVMICAIPALTIFRNYGIFVWMPTSGYVEIARAVDFLEPGDEEAFDDPKLRDICLTMLENKKLYPNADQNTNMWQVAVAAAEEHGYDHITCSTVFGKISRKILFRHFSEFVNALIDTMKTALDRTRLQIGPVSFPAMILMFLILSVLSMNIDSFTGLILMIGHITHLGISMMNQPERRYIYSTEILCLLGWLLIIIAVTLKKREKKMN